MGCPLRLLPYSAHGLTLSTCKIGLCNIQTCTCAPLPPFSHAQELHPVQMSLTSISQLTTRSPKNHETVVPTQCHKCFSPSLSLHQPPKQGLQTSTDTPVASFSTGPHRNMWEHSTHPTTRHTNHKCTLIARSTHFLQLTYAWQIHTTASD